MFLHLALVAMTMEERFKIMGADFLTQRLGKFSIIPSPRPPPPTHFSSLFLSFHSVIKYQLAGDFSKDFSTYVRAIFLHVRLKLSIHVCLSVCLDLRLF